MAQYLGKDEITPFDHVQLQRVPLIIHIPGVTDKKPKVISKVSGQIDVKPTLLHLLGIDTRNQIHFGEDLFSKDKLDFVVLRDGSFVTKDYVYTKTHVTIKNRNRSRCILLRAVYGEGATRARLL